METEKDQQKAHGFCDAIWDMSARLDWGWWPEEAPQEPCSLNFWSGC